MARCDQTVGVDLAILFQRNIHPLPPASAATSDEWANTLFVLSGF